MKHTFSFFNTTDDLLKCHAVQLYAHLHDVQLLVGKETALSFICPRLLDESNTHLALDIIYDSFLVDITHVSIQEFSRNERQSLIVLHCTAKDIGSSEISFSQKLTMQENENLILSASDQ